MSKTKDNSFYNYGPEPGLNDRHAVVPRHSGGNHLSNTTSLTHVFFKRGESCSKLCDDWHDKRKYLKRMKPYSTSSVRQVVPPKAPDARLLRPLGGPEDGGGAQKNNEINTIKQICS